MEIRSRKLPSIRAGLAGGLEEVLIILQGVHEEIPELKVSNQPVYLAPPPPAEPGEAPGAPAQAAPTGGPNNAAVGPTDADRIREHYKEVGEAQGHKFGENPPGSKPADFNLQVKPGETPPSSSPPPRAPPSQPKAAPVKTDAR